MFIITRIKSILCLFASCSVLTDVSWTQFHKVLFFSKGSCIFHEVGFIETVHVFIRESAIYFIPMCLLGYLSIYCAMLLIRQVTGCGTEHLNNWTTEEKTQYWFHPSYYKHLIENNNVDISYGTKTSFYNATNTRYILINIC